MNTSKQVNVMIGLMFLVLVGTLLYFIWDDVRADDAEQRQIVANAERGGEVFSLNCRSCHGLNGLGTLENTLLPGFPLNVDLNRPDDPGKLLERQNIIRDTIRCGRVGTLMPQWAEDQGGPLNEFQIEQLVALITGAMPGLDTPDNLDAVSEKGWEAARDAADEPEADLLEGKKLAQAIDADDTVLVLTDAQGLTVDSLLRLGEATEEVDYEVVKVLDAPAGGSLVERVTADQTDLPVERADELFQGGDIVQIDDEVLRVVSVSEDILMVERGVEGTEARGHGLKARVFEPSGEITVERAAFATDAAEHEEGAQVFAGPIEPPTGPLTGANGIGPCGQRGVAAPPPSATPSPAGETPAAGASVDVGLAEFSINPAQDAADAGTLTFTVSNDGAIAHNFRVIKTDLAPDALPTANAQVDEAQVDVVASIPDFNAGETQEVSVDLEAGSYVLICNIPGHYDLEMRAAFTVE